MQNGNLNFFEESGWLLNTAAMVRVEVTVHNVYAEHMLALKRIHIYAVPIILIPYQRLYCSCR
jgi:hypothetical protein